MYLTLGNTVVSILIFLFFPRQVVTMATSGLLVCLYLPKYSQPWFA